MALIAALGRFSSWLWLQSLRLRRLGTLPVQTSPSPGLGFDAVVTETDKAITIQSGQKLEVVLHADRNDQLEQRQVQRYVGAVSDRESSATAVRGVTLAAFQALRPVGRTLRLRPGRRARLVSVPMYVMLYSVTVTVI